MQYTMPWLDPAEQKTLIGKLLDWELIKFSNDRDLSLKSGETTDVYINLREARRHSDAIRLISRSFENPLRRINPDLFIEVPDAVSCFAGVICENTDISYVTIREQAKAGRVSNASMIGGAKRNSSAVIIDDVITDGESKVAPYREARAAGWNVEQLIVLVDRQQGWKGKFLAEKIDLPVWPGMTLHDVRKLLISDFDLMQRCDSAIEEKNPIIVALDGKSWEDILPIIDRLRPTGSILKVNDLLFNEGIKWLLPNLQIYGRVMADLKGHDISATLGNISKHFLPNPPWAVTVHASGGQEMISKVVEILKGTPTKVLAVTVLTSIKDECEEIYHRLPIDQVKDLAKIAHSAGAHGLVCSPEELGVLRTLYPTMTLVPAGIRSEGASKGDQKRTGTPADAMGAGANYIVMGRQILGADDPIVEIQRILTEELHTH
jgi:orotidine-5'-phosphate decarboxylase